MEGSNHAYLFSLVPIVVGALILGGALLFWRSGREFRNTGVTTQATVVSKQRRPTGHLLVLKFSDVNGNPRTVEIKERSARTGTIHEGSTIPITYPPAHPEKARLGRKWGASIEGWLALLVAAFGGGMVIYGLYLVLGLVTGKLKPGNL